MKTNKTILTISMKTKTAIECQECQGLNTAFVTMNPNVFGYHLKKTHGGMSVEAYEVKWVYGGVHPRCKTCESELRRPKGGFWTYCSKTCASKGENNPMYGKFGNASPNKGKVRTAEHRERYRQAAYKRFEDQPELIEKVRNHTIQRVMNGTFQKKGIVKQIDPVTGSEESYDSQWEADAVHWLISVIGYCDLTKQHDIRIPYLLSEDGKEHFYVPDFLSVARKTIVEVRGRFDKLKGVERLLAGKKWCLEHGYEFKIISRLKSGVNQLFVEMDVLDGHPHLVGPKPHGIDQGNDYSFTTPLLWKGKALTRRGVESLSIEERESVALSVFNWYRHHGFPYPTHNKEQLLKEWDKTKAVDNIISVSEDGKVEYSTKNTTGTNLMKHFNGGSYYSVSSKNKQSVISVFKDDESLMKVIRNRLGITYKETFPITGAMLRQGFRSMRLGSNTSTFNVSVAKAVYQYFCKPGDLVWDISAGFGQRMLGAMAAGVDYRGCDPWKTVVDGNNKMLEIITGNDDGVIKARVVCSGSEQEGVLKALDVEAGSVKLVFSSPPYYDVEIYDGGTGNQAACMGRTFGDYLIDWWEPTLRNIDRALSDDGKLVINMTKPMVHHLIETAERYGFVIVEEQLMKMKRGHFSPTKTVADEPFVVMKKFKPA